MAYYDDVKAARRHLLLRCAELCSLGLAVSHTAHQLLYDRECEHFGACSIAARIALSELLSWNRIHKLENRPWMGSTKPNRP